MVPQAVVVLNGFPIKTCALKRNKYHGKLVSLSAIAVQ